MPRVAIIGSGPGGLVAARYLQSEGFNPVLFEQASLPGGQWSGEAICSGVWPSMRTNTSRVLTQFSDQPHAPGLAVYPSNREIGDYLQRYADRFGLSAQTRLRTTVREIASMPQGWAVRHAAHHEEIFDKVVVACGRFQHARIPEVPGLASFAVAWARIRGHLGSVGPDVSADRVAGPVDCLCVERRHRGADA